MTIHKYIKRLQSVSLIEVFILLSVIALAVFVVKSYRQTPPSTHSVKLHVIGLTWDRLGNAARGYRPQPWLLNQLKVGNLEKSLSGQILGKVTQIEAYTSVNLEPDIYLILDLSGSGNSGTGQFTHNNQIVSVGNRLDLTLNGTQITGEVVSLNTHLDPKPYTLFVTGRISPVDSWLLNSLKIGDTVSNTNQIVAEVVDFKTVPSQNQLISRIVNQNNRIVSTTNPNAKDALITLKISVLNFANQPYFGYTQRVIQGLPLFIAFNHYVLNDFLVETVSTTNP